MNNAVREIEVKSLPALLEAAIDELPQEEPLWFRGVSDQSYELKPKVYRNLVVGDGRDFLTRTEEEMLLRFRQKAMPYLPALHAGFSNASLLVHMQHYGAPTRLLDWTENLLVAAFFSIDSARRDPNKVPAVWALRPAEWNRKASTDFENEQIPVFDSPALRPDQSPLIGWLPLDKENRSSFGKKELALAVYATHSNDRIRAQQGVFTVAGTDMRGLEIQATELKNVQDPVLYKFSFVSGAKRLSYELSQIGYRKSLIYPGLESICLELEGEFGR
ncbi:FRG domain-containing protein [Corynebacterium pilbarense]